MRNAKGPVDETFQAGVFFYGAGYFGNFTKGQLAHQHEGVEAAGFEKFRLFGGGDVALCARMHGYGGKPVFKKA